VNSQVVVNSLAVKKNKEANFNFVKYDIEVSIEEIENKDTKSKLKFVITLLSEPKNVRLSIDGHVEISGIEAERAKFLEKDENNIPQVLHLIYKELFPLFFMLTKSVGVPCPAYKLSEISAPTEGQKIDDSELQTTESSDVQSEELVETEIEEKPETSESQTLEKPIEQTNEPQTIETPTPEAKPEPQTIQSPQPETKPKPQTIQSPQPETKPEPQTIQSPQPETKPEPQTIQSPKPEAKPEPQTVQPPQPEAKPEPQTIQPPQPEAKPEPQTETSQPGASNSPSEMNLENKTTEELRTLYEKLSNDYQANPSDNIRNELEKIQNIMQKSS